MDTHRSKRISKLYRKLITSDATQAFLIYKGLDETTKAELLDLVAEMGSQHSEKLMNKIS
ncbi:hypothetical protein B0G93_12056 [Bacillus sp. V-88]|jgi:hypothetical protein|uniref:Uncharacterized protein n=1 Tax=Rossellomorea vietnamensis TaxID=218284 RepID=A0A0P6W5A9_9BACI|nr:hypothetical protein [Rossellomorea aquimaris]KPL60131.1 hypothetical protein AM506_08745 [Rossellomorea vietnamensis]OXS56760.1 hypothetical protein B1B00_16690 [Bacillus sp. DSM 27956]PFG06387.1 hypothetical protein ATG71_3242 [Bacillus sp. es.034]PRX73298.1 hypothetical protein B0G93_12056 [Bacillus sp. V-88]MCA1058824.1 hypothetical protein [Rossellomorea aquimaris]